MSFSELLTAAKNGDEWAVVRLIHMYRPLISKLSYNHHEFDEDLYQEQVIVFMRCIEII